MIDLNPKHLKTIQYILAEYIPDTKFVPLDRV